MQCFVIIIVQIFGKFASSPIFVILMPNVKHGLFCKTSQVLIRSWFYVNNLLKRKMDIYSPRMLKLDCTGVSH